MQNNRELLHKIYLRWINKEASPEEVDLFLDMLKDEDVDGLLDSFMKARWEEGQAAYHYDERRQMEVVSDILKQYPAAEFEDAKSAPFSKYIKLRIFRYAAAILLSLGVGAYLWRTAATGEAEHAGSARTAAIKTARIAILPGSDKATLTVADGTTIPLTGAHKGQLVRQSGATVVQSDNGEIAYLPDTNNVLSLASFNTMRTPRGGTYRLRLSDGTMVWLNAASSITFPTRFEGKQRDVSITGEVYFEVAKNKDKPFQVNVNRNVRIEVLGTSFNVNAYEDESGINTTLFTGSVKVANNEEIRLLIPGQQAHIESGRKTIVKDEPEFRNVIAWKNDEFYFGEKADFPTIMRQIARWYDIEVIYQARITAHFGGSLSRKTGLTEVLHMLEKTGEVKFGIEGKKITVLPNEPVR